MWRMTDKKKRIRKVRRAVPPGPPPKLPAQAAVPPEDALDHQPLERR